MYLYKAYIKSKKNFFRDYTEIDFQHQKEVLYETRRIKTIRQNIGYGDEFRKGCLIVYPQFPFLFNFISYIFYLERFE